MFLINLFWRLIFFIAVLVVVILLPIYFLLGQQQWLIKLATSTATSALSTREITGQIQGAMQLILGGTGFPDYFNQQEASHLLDVHQLVVFGLWLLISACLLLLILFIFFKIFQGISSFWQFVRQAAKWSIWLLLIIIFIGLISFPLLWQGFHRLFFPQGNFSFAADSNLIQLFSTVFFQKISIILAAASLTLSIIIIFGTARYRSAK